MTNSSVASFLLNPGLVPFCLAGVQVVQTSIVQGIVSFAKKMAAENREKRKQSGVLGIDGSSLNQKNRLVHISDTLNAESRWAIDVEVIQKQMHQDRAITRKAIME
jgi:hypothetical protein